MGTRTRTCWLLVTALAFLLPVGTRGEEESAKVKARRLVREFKDLRKSPDWEKIKKRRDLIVEMGDTEDSLVLPTLLEAFLKDREQLCRIQAMISIGKQGTFPYLKKLVQTARTERDDVFLMALPLALRHSRDEKIGAWLLKSLLGVRKPPTARPAAIECLGSFREASARAPLEKGLEKERDVRILYESLIALARIAGPDVEGTIVPFLDHKDLIVRQAAVEALGEIDTKTSTERLLTALKADEPRVKEAAAGSLAARKHEEAVPALIDELKPTNGLRVRDTMRNALKALTGEDHGVDQEAWQAWLKRRDSGGGPPPADPGSSSVATYWSLPVFSDKVLFVVDISGSMDAGKPQRIDAHSERKATG